MRDREYTLLWEDEPGLRSRFRCIATSAERARALLQEHHPDCVAVLKIDVEDRPEPPDDPATILAAYDAENA